MSRFLWRAIGLSFVVLSVFVALKILAPNVPFEKALFVACLFASGMGILTDNRN